MRRLAAPLSIGFIIDPSGACKLTVSNVGIPAIDCIEMIESSGWTFLVTRKPDSVVRSAGAFMRIRR